MGQVVQQSERVQNIIKFCEMLTVPDGMYVGDPVRLRPWQKAFINDVYGPSASDGRRIVRKALLTMGRKNAKTALIAMLALVHICGPEAVRNSEIYSLAFERDQAAQVFKYMTAMICSNSVLTELLNIVDTQKMVRYPKMGTMYKALSAESRSKHGKSPVVVIFDELAQFGQDRRLYDVMNTAVSAHACPLTFFISTQAPADADLFSTLVDYGKRVNSGVVNDRTFVAHIYEAPEVADPFAEATWMLANPALGDFKSMEYMRQQAMQAKEMPSFLPAFLNLELNQRVSAEASFVTQEVWKRNGAAPDIAAFSQGGPVLAGLDLSSKNDLTALVLVAFDQFGNAHALPWFWTPKEGIRDRSHRDRVPYEEWAKTGFLEACPGHSVDYSFVAYKIRELHADYSISAIRFDRWKISDLIRELNKDDPIAWEDGKDEPIPGGICMKPHGQGFKDMNGAVESLEDHLLNGRVRHGMHPVLTMCAANARVVRDPAENRKFDKIKSIGRIDGLVALAMALNVKLDPMEEPGDITGFFSDPIVVGW